MNIKGLFLCQGKVKGQLKLCLFFWYIFVRAKNKSKLSEKIFLSDYRTDSVLVQAKVCAESLF